MRMKLILKILAGVAAVLLLILVGLNFLLSADAVRDRVAARVKEQTGRDLKVNGSSSLLFLPNPHVVLTDVEITDPENRAGADLHVARLALDVSFMQLLSRKVDADRVVMEQPVLTVRLKDAAGAEQQGSLEAPAHAATKPRFALAQAAGGGGALRRDIVLNDVRIEDGTVRILYDGTERRVEHINANLSLPHLVDPLTAKGDFDWKGLKVGFDVKLATPAELSTERGARLEFGVITDAINADFGGYVSTLPAFSAQGELVAKTQSVPSVLAWVRKDPATVTAVGSGEVSSHIDWNAGEISLTQLRFALSHAVGQGQAVMTLTTPKPHLRAALAVETLNLDPFFAARPVNAGSAPPASAPSVQPAPGEEPAETVHQFTEAPAPVTADPPSAPPPWAAGPQPAPQAAPQAAPQPSAAAPVVLPAAFDADANINIRETRLARLVVGPSSHGLSLRDGVLAAALNSVQLYEGQGSGKLTLDAGKPKPSFTGTFALDGVSTQPLLVAAAGFDLLAGRAELGFEFNGAGSSVEEIKHSLGGTGSIDIEDGSIQGINLTELIESLGAGSMPNLNQGPGAKTDFSVLGGTFTMASGVAETHDLEMTSELLEVKARGTVDVVTGTLDFLTQPEIKAGKRGNNKLAGLSIPVRIEGPFAQPRIRPEIAGMFSSPGGASNTVNQIGEMLQQNLKGKPVGEAIGRILGSVKIGKDRGEEDGAGGPAEDDTQTAEPAEEDASESGEPQEEDAPAQEEDEATGDPDIDEILR
jgi:AsmA protein